MNAGAACFSLTLSFLASQIRAMQIHVARNSQQLGIFSIEEVNRQLTAGTLNLTDLAWYEGAAGWAPLASVPGVSGSAPSSTPPPSATPVTPTPITPNVPAIPAPTVPAVPSVPAASTEPLAIWSLVLSLVGLLGFCCGGPLLGIAGVVCGHLGLSKISANPRLQGRGLALAGLIIGYFAIVSWVLYLIFFGGLSALQGILDSSRR